MTEQFPLQARYIALGGAIADMGLDMNSRGLLAENIPEPFRKKWADFSSIYTSLIENALIEKQHLLGGLEIILDELRNESVLIKTT
jgi:hypothetical protein